jgi:hypothetical protein
MEVSMLFCDNNLFEHALVELGVAMRSQSSVPIDPLPCDRWIARSCLQKAVRRAEPELAQRALANLFDHDSRAVWRHLSIIALEDVGVANVDVLARIVAAQRDRKWREQMGGDWAVIAELVRQMATSTHCQATCDVLLRVMNDPGLAEAKADALEQEPGALAAVIGDGDHLAECRGIAAMAMAGCLADGQHTKDPSCVFDVLADGGASGHVVATCRIAWKISRNPMALLLPIVWQECMKADDPRCSDDTLPPLQLIGGVPGYALDQFTRTGNRVSRAYLAEDDELRHLLEAARICKGSHSRTLGDVLFLIEGGLVRHRMIWAEAERLRRPYRWLPSVPMLGQHILAIQRHCQAKASEIGKTRLRLYHP